MSKYLKFTHHHRFYTFMLLRRSYVKMSLDRWIWTLNDALIDSILRVLIGFSFPRLRGIDLLCVQRFNFRSYSTYLQI